MNLTTQVALQSSEYKECWQKKKIIELKPENRSPEQFHEK